MEEAKRAVIVVGHRNPDTDSICSAIAYARLKQALTGKEHMPCRAGAVNPETQYVLEKFHIPVPELIEDVRTQVKDIEIRKTKGVRSNISLKKAWTLMKELGVVTLPITRDNRLEGLITIGDIANSYMNVYDSAILSAACTQFVNIKETLEGVVVVGDEKNYFDQGKVLVAAANPDLMESYIEEHDLVILGNRYESQLCAIEMNAGCIVVCDGAPVSMTIKKLAEDHQCTVISTPFDTFTASRLINQSMPIGYFMTTKQIISFDLEDYTDDIKDIMASKRHRDFPILDRDGRYQGMISRRNLLGMKRKEVILVDHNERSQAVSGIESAEILEIIDHHRLGSLETVGPVFFRNQPLGCTGTIVYQMYGEAGVEIGPEVAGLLCSAIVSDTLLYRSPTCTEADRAAAEALAKLAGIDTKQFAREMFAAGSNLKKKSEKEIFYQDYKVFDIDGVTVGISQLSSMDVTEFVELKGRMLPYIEKMKSKHKVDMLFFMLTSILDESTEVLCDGTGGVQLLEQAFPGCAVSEFSVALPGVVSRKKQFVPALVMVMQG